MSKPIDDGGPAFPTPGEEFIEGPQGRCPASAWGMEGKPGMTLRDWFAGQALQGLLAKDGNKSSKYTALLAYEYADAMISARKGSQ
jgi:hypothetical protein